MNLKENIARMEQELADMKKQLDQQDKLELKRGKFQFEVYGAVNTNKYSDLCVANGTTRATKELAEIASKNMVTRNRLEAYVHQIQGDGEGKYTISRLSDVVCVSSHFGEYNPLCTVYMKKATAEILCEKLNAGKIEL